jgi:hypothetical protein
MAHKKNPAEHVTAFFETASLETAQTVLAICKGVLARRFPAKQKARPARVSTAGTEHVAEETARR